MKEKNETLCELRKVMSRTRYLEKMRGHIEKSVERSGTRPNTIQETTLKKIESNLLFLGDKQQRLRTKLKET